MRTISWLFKLTDASRIRLLQTELREIAEDFLIIAITSPLGILDGHPKKALDDRKRWLEANVINPVAILQNALSDDQAPMFAEWPEQVNVSVGKIEQAIGKHPQLKRALKKEGESRFRATFGQLNDPSREVIVTVLAFDVPTGDQ